VCVTAVNRQRWTTRFDNGSTQHRLFRPVCVADTVLLPFPNRSAETVEALQSIEQGATIDRRNIYFLSLNKVKKLVPFERFTPRKSGLK